ncbi:MAG: hypothetical protein Q4B60_06760 [Erysipelotrichaceae bacterium]|nr:hypothetical protein [Erysipelotrichaceae bacterium]
MNVQLIIEDKQESYKEVHNIVDIEDRNHFSYTDDTGAKNVISVFSDGVEVRREDTDHSTTLVLRSDSFVEISSEEGVLNFSLKVLAINLELDNIVIAYQIGDTTKELTIKYLGDK